MIEFEFRAGDSRGAFGYVTKEVVVPEGIPDAPTVASPRPSQVFSLHDDQMGNQGGVQITVSGMSVPNAEIVITVDGATTKGAADSTGAYLLSGITIRTHGKQLLRVSATTPAGAKSVSRDVPIRYDNPPAVSKRGAGNGEGRDWVIADPDGTTDVAVSLRVKRASGAEETGTLTQNGDVFSWDSGAVGKNEPFELRMEVSDGTTKSEVVEAFFVGK